MTVWPVVLFGLTLVLFIGVKPSCELGLTQMESVNRIVKRSLAPVRQPRGENKIVGEGFIFNKVITSGLKACIRCVIVVFPFLDDLIITDGKTYPLR